MIPWYITLGTMTMKATSRRNSSTQKPVRDGLNLRDIFSFTKKLHDTTPVLFVILDSSPLVKEYINQKEDGTSC